MRILKPVLKITAAILVFALIIGLAYVAYAFLGCIRIADNQTLAIREGTSEELPVGKELSALTWNLGYCANSAETSFFMDGGTGSRAASKEIVLRNLDGIRSVLEREDADLMLLQEVDVAADRSRFVDEVNTIAKALPATDAVYAENYHSSFLLYPVTDPIGRTRSGLVTLSRASITTSIRRQLPVMGGFARVIDLDRCYSVSDVTVEGGRTLRLYDLHLSAYTSDPKVRDGQLEKLFTDIQADYRAGCYVLVGGDFNRCLTGNGTDAYTWSTDFPMEKLPDGFTVCADKGDTHSTRLLDAPYEPGKNFTITIDGFIVSDNITVTQVTTLDEGFAFSDHNPVKLTLSLNA